MTVVNIYEAKTQLSRLIDAARRGEDIVIAKDSTPMVRLVPVEGPGVIRRLGTAKGKVVIADDFDAPIPGMSEFEP
jgi:prevent-host-death family protein